MSDLLLGALATAVLVLVIQLAIGRLLFPWLLATRDIARELHIANDLARQRLAQGSGPAQGAAQEYVLGPNGWMLQEKH